MSSTFVVADHNKNPIQCSVDSGNLHQYGLRSQLLSHRRNGELRQLELDDRKGNDTVPNGATISPVLQTPSALQHPQNQDSLHGNQNPRGSNYSMPNNYTAPQPMFQQVQNVAQNGTGMGNMIQNPGVNTMAIQQPPNFVSQARLLYQCPPFNPSIAFTWLGQQLDWFKSAIAYIEQPRSVRGITQVNPKPPVGSGQVDVSQPVVETSDTMSHAETTSASSAVDETVKSHDSSEQTVTLAQDCVSSEQLVSSPVTETGNGSVVNTRSAETNTPEDEKIKIAVQATLPGEVALPIVAKNVAEQIAPATSPASEEVEQRATPVVKAEDEADPEAPSKHVVQISNKSIARALRKERQLLREAQQSVADSEAKSVPAPTVSSKNAKKRAQKEKKKNKATEDAQRNEKDLSNNEDESKCQDGATDTVEVGDRVQMEEEVEKTAKSVSIGTATAPPVATERTKKKNKGKKEKIVPNLANNNEFLSVAVKLSHCENEAAETQEVGNQRSSGRTNSPAAEIPSASTLVTKEAKKTKKKCKKSVSSNENRTDETVPTTDVMVPKSTVKDGAKRKASKSAQVSGTGLPLKMAAEKAKKKKKKCTKTVSNNENHFFTLESSKSPEEHHDHSNSTKSPSCPDQDVNSSEVQEADLVSPGHESVPETKSDATNIAFSSNVDPHGLSMSSEVSQSEFSISDEPSGSENKIVFVSIQSAPENEFLSDQATPKIEPVASVRTNKNEVDDFVSETTLPETLLETECQHKITTEVVESRAGATPNLSSRVEESNQISPSTSSTKSHSNDVADNFQPILQELIEERAIQLQFEELKKSKDLKTYYKSSWKPDNYLNEMAVKVLNYYLIMFPIRSNYAHLRPKDFVDPNLEDPTGLLQEIVNYRVKKPLFFWKNKKNMKKCQKYLEERLNDYKGATDPTKKSLYALYKMVSLSMQPHFNFEDIMYFCSKVTSRAEKRKMDEQYLEMFEHVIKKHVQNAFKPEIFAKMAYARDNITFVLLKPAQFLHLKKYLRTMYQLRNGLYTDQQKTKMIESLTPSQRKMLEFGEKIQSECEWSSKQTEEFLEKLMESIETLEILGEDLGKCFNLYLFLTGFESSVIDHDCYIYIKTLKKEEGEYHLTLEDHEEILRPWFSALE